MGEFITIPLQASAGAISNNTLQSIPGVQDSALVDTAWYTPTIQGVLWSESFPYQLVLLQQSGGNFSIIEGSAFVLPVNPEAYNREMPFAIKLAVTMDGIVEQHNASPIRPIHISGTTGYMPLRGGGTTTVLPNFAQSILAGKLSNSPVGAIAQPQSSTTPQGIITNTVLEKTVAGQTTGYYQFLLFQQWLEAYATIKKSKAGRNIVMGFAIQKEQAMYVVTPRRFSLQRNAGQPMMWNYSLQMDAWARVNAGDNAATAVELVSIYQDASAMARLVTNLVVAQSTLQSYQATVQGTTSNSQASLYEPLRQTVLFCKNFISQSLTAADLPVNIQLQLKDPILNAAIGSNSQQTVNGLTALQNATTAELQAAYAQIVKFSTITNKSSTGASVLTGSANTIANSAIPANAILLNPQENFTFFSQIQVNQLQLPPQVQSAISQELNTINKLSRTDFSNFQSELQKFMDNYADACGAGSADYNLLYGRAQTTTTRTPSNGDWQVLASINQALIEISKLAATASTNTVIPNPMTYVAALAGPFGIQFDVPNSKYAIPFPYGFTLEQVAARYLGNPNRWIEIATLNNLAAPYVDEVGFTVPLVVPGSGYQIQVATDVNLYVNQTVYISSNTVLRKVASITAITPVGSNFVITLNIDGMEVYLPSDGAELAAYLPNTVNSQQVIYLPSQNPSTESNFQGPPNPVLADFQNQLAIGGADLLLTGNGDLAITPNGDCKLAIGLANLVQRIKLAIDTPKGTLLQHPDYGFPTIVGQATSQLNAQQILNAAQNLFKNDPAFTGVKGAQVIQNGPNVNLQMAVGIAGTDQLLPVTFEVPSQGV